MRYNNKFFTEILSEDGFVSVPHNMSTMYMSDGSNWVGS
jgi:hypothetical protein